MHGHHVQTIEQVVAKPAGLHFRAQVAVGGSQHAHVDLERARAAHALVLAGFDGAQQLGLRFRAQVGHFIQEERTAIGQLELAAPRLVRTGERALLVAEHLRLDQLARDGRAVDAHERADRARATAACSAAGHQLLARTALAGDQHARIGAARR